MPKYSLEQQNQTIIFEIQLMQRHVLAFYIRQEKAGTYIVALTSPGYSTNVYTGVSAPRSNPLPYYIPFLTKKVTPLTYLVYNFASLLTAVNALSFKQESITKIERFSRLYKVMKFICQPFWAISQTQMTDFPTLLYTSASEIPMIFLLIAV